MDKLDQYESYVVEGLLLVVFQEAMKALYADKLKDDDTRRDLANRMDAVFRYDKMEG